VSIRLTDKQLEELNISYKPGHVYRMQVYPKYSKAVISDPYGITVSVLSLKEAFEL